MPVITLELLKTSSTIKRVKSDLSGLFCPKPFEYLDIHFVNGEVQCYVCCPTWLPTPIGPDKGDEFPDIWNNEKIQKIRKSILDGSYSYCDKDVCPEIQSGNLHDKRFAQDPYHQKLIKEQKLILDKGPRIINFSEDRTCNLSCPSCRTNIISIGQEEIDKIKAFRETYLPKLLETVEFIYICSAGDPFASPIYKDFLYNLDGSKYPNLKIHLITNGVLFTEEVWKKMSKIHSNIDKVFVSLDAAKVDTYNIVRRGGDLPKAITNIKFLSSLRAENKLAHLQLDFVVQDTNFREMPEFVELGKKLKVDKVYFQRISNWGTYSKEQYDSKNVLSPSHPEHNDFLKVCSNKILSHTIVKKGNLASFFPINGKEKLKSFLKKFTIIRYIRIKFLNTLR